VVDSGVDFLTGVVESTVSRYCTGLAGSRFVGINDMVVFYMLLDGLMHFSVFLGRVVYMGFFVSDLCIRVAVLDVSALLITVPVD
jgi:hypothetical protein